MSETTIEILFKWVDDTTEMIGQHTNEPYLDSLTIALETAFYGDAAEDVDDLLAKKLQTAVKEVRLDNFSTNDIRQAVQLAIIKGMKNSTQAQHHMTPEAIALLIGYLAKKLTNDKKHLQVFDPAGGTGNLLTAVLSQLPEPGQAFASEIDPTLLRLSLINANLQKMNIELFHQDSLRPLLLDPVDLIVANLPVGYYPDDVRASKFELKADEGHSYSHHLFIEQSLNYVKDDGYLLFLIPDFLFMSDQSAKLHAFLHEHANIIGVLRLPESSFTSEKNVKSIFILQKKGEAEAPKQPLLAELPSLNNAAAMEDILGKINEWFEGYLAEQAK